MKRTIYLCLGIILVAGVAAAQSLGDVARKERQTKKPAAKRVITDDDVANSTTFNNGAASGPVTEKPADKSEAKPGEAEPAAVQDKDKAQLTADWRGKIDAQKKSIALLTRELDVMQREHQIKLTAYYADAGNRFRDERAWFASERQAQADIAAKTKDLQDARTKLDDLRDQARKAGVPQNAID